MSGCSGSTRNNEYDNNLNCKQKETPNRLLRTGAECSLGVYYVHMLVLTAIEHLGLIGDDHIGLLAIKIVLIYGISFVLAFVISKVPYVKKVLLGL